MSARHLRTRHGQGVELPRPGTKYRIAVDPADPGPPRSPQEAGLTSPPAQEPDPEPIRLGGLAGALLSPLGGLLLVLATLAVAVVLGVLVIVAVRP